MPSVIHAAPPRAATAPDPVEQPLGVADALDALGEGRLADRLRRCARSAWGRDREGGWPWLCGSVGCARCGRRAVRRWSAALRHWIGELGGVGARGTARTTTFRLPPAALRGVDAAAAARGLRRALRDLRDRRARRDARWRSVAFGALLADGRPVVLVAHPDLPHGAVAAALARRWPGGIADARLPDAGEAPDLHAQHPEGVARLAALRRGVEPIRVVVAPQGRGGLANPAGGAAVADDDDPWGEPMPVCV